MKPRDLIGYLSNSLAVVLLLFTLHSVQAQSLTIAVKYGLSLGVIADCQYADVPPTGVRHYSLSDQKLSECVEEFNRNPLDHVFHLGDFIDRDPSSFEAVLPLVNQLNANHTLVLGNHDFSVPDELKMQVPGLMGLQQRYFAVFIKGWKFVILDGNDLSLYAWPSENQHTVDARRLHQEKYSQLPTYNGALSREQLTWLENELEESEKNQEKVILLCHFPVLPEDNHVLWNAKEVIELISPFKCVKAWLNGHNHAGGYAQHAGIHFVTFKGMVDTEENSFAIVRIDQNQLVINGFGREGDQVLMLKRD